MNFTTAKNLNQNQYATFPETENDGLGWNIGEDEDDYVLSALSALWDEPLTYVKQYTKALGSINLGYFISWFTQQCQPDEWLILNDQIIQYELGLSAKQWRKIRQELMQMDLLIRKRINHQSAFSLNDRLLEELMSAYSNLSVEDLTAPLISINSLQLKALTHYGASIKAIIFFATLQHHTLYRPLSQRGEWSEWTKLPEKTVTHDTYLSRHEQDNAIKNLTQLGVIESQIKGLPATRYCRFSNAQLGMMTEEYHRKFIYGCENHECSSAT